MGGKMPKEYYRQYYRKNLAATPTYSGERKTTPKAKRCPTREDMAWAAGFLEGDGYFQAQHGGAGTVVTATQCNLEPLERLQELFGGTIRPKHMSASNRQQPYAWSAYGARARGIMMVLYLWLSERRRARCRAALKAVTRVTEPAALKVGEK